MSLCIIDLAYGLTSPSSLVPLSRLRRLNLTDLRRISQNLLETVHEAPDDSVAASQAEVRAYESQVNQQIAEKDRLDAEVQAAKGDFMCVANALLNSPL